MKLGVNIDHVATLREARKDLWPNLIFAAKEAIIGGADGITIHLREDRRHIQDDDVYKISALSEVRHLNLEMSVAQEIVDIALEIQPAAVCLVPEKREELTTEGGLDIIKGFDRIKEVTDLIQQQNTAVSLFIDPLEEQIKAAKESGAKYIELHTGEYAETFKHDPAASRNELQRLIKAAQYAKSLGINVNAGHGLTYDNVAQIAEHQELFEELNIGHNIIARAVFVGIKTAVEEMKELLTIS